MKHSSPWGNPENLGKVAVPGDCLPMLCPRGDFWERLAWNVSCLHFPGSEPECRRPNRGNQPHWLGPLSETLHSSKGQNSCALGSQKHSRGIDPLAGIPIPRMFLRLSIIVPLLELGIPWASCKRAHAITFVQIHYAWGMGESVEDFWASVSQLTCSFLLLEINDLLMFKQLN